MLDFTSKLALETKEKHMEQDIKPAGPKSNV